MYKLNFVLVIVIIFSNFNTTKAQGIETALQQYNTKVPQ